MLGLGVIGTVGSILYPLAQYLIPPKIPESKTKMVKVGKVDEFPVNSGKLFRFGRKPGILIHTQQGDFRAFIAICTHLSCTVQYRDDWKLIWCACHNGKFDLTGKNISGPPPRPLTPLKVVTKNDEIYVMREA